MGVTGQFRALEAVGVAGQEVAVGVAGLFLLQVGGVAAGQAPDIILRKLGDSQ